MSAQLEAMRRYVAELPAPAEGAATGPVLLVGSGKGGTGTSTLAGLIAVLAAADGREVLLVDADESHGALPLLFGVEAPYPLAALRGGAISPRDLLVPLGPGLTLLPVGGTAEPEERLSATERAVLLRRTGSLHRDFDLVVVDAGSRLQAVLTMVGAASRVLGVSAADRISVAATYAFVKAIGHRVPGLPVEILFNRCPLPTATAAFEQLVAATRRFVVRLPELAGAVPEDEVLRGAIATGLPLHQAAAAGSPAITSCHELSVTLARHLQTSRTPPRSATPNRSLAVTQPRLSSRR